MTDLLNIKKRGMTWLGKLKLRAAVFIIGVPLAVMGAISLGPAWLTLPLVGVAVAAVTVSLNKITSRMDSRTCWTCGADLSGEPVGDYGPVCPSCGSLHPHNPMLADADEPDPRLDDPDDTAAA